MEFVIVIMLIVVIVLLLFLLLKRNNNSDLIERLGNFNANINKEIGDFKFEFSKDLRKDFDNLNESIEKKLMYINEKVNEKLEVNFEKSSKTFENVLERLTKIDAAQKKIESLSTDINSLQNVLTDKKTRGVFGEVSLEYILSNAFGKEGIYKMQYKFKTGVIVDSILFAPEPLGTISIDSKFPLENYQKMTDLTRSKQERIVYEKAFKDDIKKHIDDIHEKYIIPGETSDEAIMFLPAEAIFAEINAYHPELIAYSNNKKVWITSPTTLISMLSIISVVLKNLERDKYTKVIHDELKKLSVEFDRYKVRFTRFTKDIRSVNSRIDELIITSDKITKRFDSINEVELDENLIEDKS